jgi:uncharacterized protein
MNEDSPKTQKDEKGKAEAEFVTIERLMIYPVKSCRGISMNESIVLDEGLEHDRHWMIVDAHGTFLTQRECPEMARIVPTLNQGVNGRIELSLSLANHQGQLDEDSTELRIAPASETGLRDVVVWKFEGQAIDCGHQAAKFLSDFLGRPARLVRFSDSEIRVCNKAWTGELNGRTQFSDGYPILILGQASVEDLATRMNLSNLVIERFRPNIVISGLPAYEEDFVHTLKLLPAQHPNSESLDGAAKLASEVIALRLVKPCPRCPVPKVDPWTGQVAQFDPAAELASYRYHELAEGAVLGMNALVSIGQGQKLARGQRFSAIYDF